MDKNILVKKLNLFFSKLHSVILGAAIKVCATIWVGYSETLSRYKNVFNLSFKIFFIHVIRCLHKMNVVKNH